MNDANFLDYYNKQGMFDVHPLPNESNIPIVTFEAQNSNAWTTETPQEILRLARDRLTSEGWDKVRPALSVSVR